MPIGFRNIITSAESGSMGEANTASNIGVGGVGVFDAKVGVDLQFRNINAGSTKVTVTDDAANNEIDIDVSEANIDHDSLLNFVANEHVDHTAVTLTAGVGLSGGGDISANRTFDLDINSLTADVIVGADTIPFNDASEPNVANKITFTNFESTLNHDNLAGFVANEHIDHTGVTLTAGVALTGGGDISANRTFDFDLTELAAEATVAGTDYLVMYDVTASAHRKILISNLPGGGGGGDYWGDPVDADILSDVNLTRDLGSSANRFAEIWGYQGAFCKGNETVTNTNTSLTVAEGYDSGTITNSGKGALAVSYVRDGGDINASGSGCLVQGWASGTTSKIEVGAFASGSQAGGYVRGNADIYTSAKGAQAFGWASGATSVIKATTNAGTARGYVKGNGNISAYGQGSTAVGYSSGAKVNASGNGSLAHGMAYGSSTSTYLLAGGAGSFAFGVARESGAYNATIKTFSSGALIGGYANSTGTGNAQIYVGASGSVAFGNSLNGGFIKSSGLGSVAMGYATGSNAKLYATSSGAVAFGKATTDGTVQGSADGSSAFGYAKEGIIEASGVGSHARGKLNSANSTYSYIKATGDGTSAIASLYQKSTYNSKVRASGTGARAGGFCNAYTGNSYIYADANGSQCWGVASGGKIYTNSYGAVSFGAAYGGYSLGSAGTGALALGRAYNASIIANAESTIQVGEGTNSEAVSIQVGDTTDGMRLNGEGAPGTKHNGDMWVAANYVYIRSNGVDVKIT